MQSAKTVSTFFFLLNEEMKIEEIEQFEIKSFVKFSRLHGDNFKVLHRPNLTDLIEIKEIL